MIHNIENTQYVDKSSRNVYNEPVKCKHCACHGRQKILAERDRDGNIYILCRGCKQKVKIEI